MTAPVKSRLLLCIIVLSILSSCVNNKSVDDKKDTPKASVLVKRGTDSILIPEKSDTVIKGLINLDMEKVDGGVNLIYKYKNETKIRTVHIAHTDYSAIVFPELAVGVITGKNSFRSERFYIINDSLLVLPLIGISNRLHVYIVNLPFEKVCDPDIRTSFSYVWVKPGNAGFITSDSPVYKDSTILYQLHEYQIKPDNISLSRVKNVEVKSEIDESLKEQFSFVKALLK